VYRVPASGSPILKDHVPAVTMIGWHDEAEPTSPAAQRRQNGVDV